MGIWAYYVNKERRKPKVLPSKIKDIVGVIEPDNDMIRDLWGSEGMEALDLVPSTENMVLNSEADLLYYFLQSLPSEFKNHTFFDIGFGNGYTFAAALESGFKKVAGIEYFQDQVNNARQLLQSLYGPDIDLSSVIQGDFTHGINKDGETVHFYWPYKEKDLELAMKNIEQGEHVIIYCSERDHIRKFMSENGFEPAHNVTFSFYNEISGRILGILFDSQITLYKKSVDV